MAQTSVEWLENQLTLALGDELKDLRGLFVVANEMHEQQIRNAYNTGWDNAENYAEVSTDQYYNETYKTQAT
jgi:hypothetical protein